MMCTQQTIHPPCTWAHPQQADNRHRKHRSTLSSAMDLAGASELTLRFEKESIMIKVVLDERDHAFLLGS